MNSPSEPVIDRHQINLCSILRELESMASSREVYVAGGPIRDWILGRKILDLDLVVPDRAIALAQHFAQETGGHFVLLDKKEGVARVVSPGFIVDFTRYRDGARTIEEDLYKRDFTMNAMALPLSSAFPLLSKALPLPIHQILDPRGGLADLESQTIRAISQENLVSDPLRLFRAYRFRSQLDFEIEQQTWTFIKGLSSTIGSVAPERIDHELRLIMESERASRTLREMFQVGLLQPILPEIVPMDGMAQPGFHHLDCLGHSFAAIESMEAIIACPCQKFPICRPIETWIGENMDRVPDLKWAAFLHDIGKPSCRGKRGDRLTFYQHDLVGSGMTLAIGERMRWPRQRALFVAKMVKLHMRPFYLIKDFRCGGPSKQAMRRILKESGTDYPALFLLAMADSMAGCGPLKPPDLDAMLAGLWEKVHIFYQDLLRPVEMRPRLLTGHDIQRLFGLSPGPLIGKALDVLEEVQIEGTVTTQDEAVTWLGAWLDSRDDVSQP